MRRLWSASLGFVLSIMALAAPFPGYGANTGCAERRLRSANIEHDADLQIGRLALVQGHIPHAGSVEHNGEVRPIPQLSPIDYKRAFARTMLPEIQIIASDALFFVLASAEYPATDPEVIEVDALVYFCLAAKGDLILLSDGPTNHYTNVVSVDEDGSGIVLIDRWPEVLTELIGARPERLVGKSGRTSGATLIRFERDDFLKLFRAALTIDTPAFPEILKNVIGDGEWKPEMQAAVGRALLYSGQYSSHSVKAADALNLSLRAAKAGGDEALIRDTVPAALTTNLLAHFVLRAAGDDEKAAAALAYARDLETHFGELSRQPLSAEDSLRIGLVARRIDPDAAIYFFNDAVRRDPTDPRPWLYRSQTSYAKLQGQLALFGGDAQDIKDVIASLRADVEESIRLMNAKEQVILERWTLLEKNQGEYWQMGLTRAEEDSVLRGEIEASRADAKELLESLRLLADEGIVFPPQATP